MADLSSSPAPPKTRRDDTLELDADLERMTEDVENMSVQLSWMTYDMVELRTRPELALRMRELEEAYRRCRDAVYGEACQVTPQEPGQMENTEKEAERAVSSACIDLENILRGLDSLSNSMNQLALRTHLKQCDLIVCVGHPEKLAFLRKMSETGKQQPSA